MKPIDTWMIDGKVNPFWMLRAPFPLSEIEFRPMQANKDRTRCAPAAYADVRTYFGRLNRIFGLNWDVSYQPWGDGMLIAVITIHYNGQTVVRSSTGSLEEKNPLVKQGQASTLMEAQAFKRACVTFGMGEYLYNCNLPWGPLVNNRIPDNFLKEIRGVYEKHVIRTLKGLAPTAITHDSRRRLTHVWSKRTEEYIPVLECPTIAIMLGEDYHPGVLQTLNFANAPGAIDAGIAAFVNEIQGDEKKVASLEMLITELKQHLPSKKG